MWPEGPPVGRWLGLHAQNGADDPVPGSEETRAIRELLPRDAPESIRQAEVQGDTAHLRGQ